MGIMNLAFKNVKNSLRNYLSLILSLSFTILVFLNFQYMVYSDALSSLGESNKNNVYIVIEVISVVLGCFSFFFIWYSTNVFLTKRKKEIGTYVFMGLTNQRIGKLYAIESTIIGVASVVLGTCLGLLTTQLFQMILLAVSDVAADIRFNFALRPIVNTMALYMAIYMIFVLKGYISIVRSSVLDMVSANRQNEYVKQKRVILILKAIAGVCVMTAGFYMAVKDAGIEVLTNALAAVVLVIIGVYLLFGGLIPLIFQGLEKNKRFLYQGQRTLWINNVIFRMKKNYRTYAIVCILMLCSVTALATGFAMNIRHDNMVNFRNTYTFQILTNQHGLKDQVTSLIETDNDIEYESEASMIYLSEDLIETLFNETNYSIISYSQIKKLAADAGLEFDLPEPSDDEIISVSQMHLMSFVTDISAMTVKINGKEYSQIAETSVPYLGYLQEIMSYYMVNDAEYQRILPLGEQLDTYNYRIQDIYNYASSLDDLAIISSNTQENYTARVAINPNSDDIEWIKILYSLFVFMFMVFIMASGSILFMKLYNDAFDDRERYAVLQKLGFSQRTLEKSVARELGTAYILPFAVMAISSYFSVHALSKVMHTDLIMINIVSVMIILAFFMICCFVSIPVYRKNAGIQK